MLKRGFRLLASVMVWFASASSAFAVTLTLGNAAQFAALSTTKSVSIGKNADVPKSATPGTGFTGGQSVTLGANSDARSDAIANPKGITVGKNAGVLGACVTNG